MNIDYTKYLSIDNKKGILLSRGDIEVLNRYGFDYTKYDNLKKLIMDIDDYLIDNYISEDDLEEVLIKLSDSYYYNYLKK